MSDEFVEETGFTDEDRFEAIHDKGFLNEDGYLAYRYGIYDCIWEEGQVSANFNLFNGSDSISLGEKRAKELVTVLEYYLAKIEDCRVVIKEALEKKDEI